MHVHELNPWRTLIVLSLFIVLLIVGFFTMYQPALTFEKNMSESLADLQDYDALYNPSQLVSVINGEEKNVVLFDIRDRFIYGQGNIPGSENISAHDLTLTENIERLKDLRDGNITVVLYGENQLEANGPWMLFRQMGLDNVKILLGGYQYYAAHKDNLAESEDDITLIKGYPNYDFAEVAAKKEGATEDESNVKEPVVVQRRAKVSTAAGGC